ncbi:MAG: hypothetical protein AB8H12_22235 [Lewinella sp.]
MTIDARKETIITKIKYVNENWLLKSIEKLLSDVKVGEERSFVDVEDRTDYSFYVGNIEDKVDLDKIKKERPLKKLDVLEFSNLADSLEWDQSIEELLEDLK